MCFVSVHSTLAFVLLVIIRYSQGMSIMCYMCVMGYNRYVGMGAYIVYQRLYSAPYRYFAYTDIAENHCFAHIRISARGGFRGGHSPLLKCFTYMSLLL